MLSLFVSGSLLSLSAGKHFSLVGSPQWEKVGECSSCGRVTGSVTWRWSGIFLLSTIVFTPREELGPGVFPVWWVPGFRSMAITMVTVDAVVVNFYKEVI